MSENTENLNLFKYDVDNDRKQLFGIKQALNDNWDKIDKAVGDCQDQIDSIEKIPAQDGQEDKLLTTDGKNLGWVDLNALALENKANKGQANGYAALNSSGKVPASQLDLTDKQDKLTAGENITIENNVISSKSFSGEYKDLTGQPTKLSEFIDDIGLNAGFVEGRDYDVL